MANITKLTYDEIANACRRIMAEGKSPSLNSVYAAIGRRGGADVVQRFILQWRRETAGTPLAPRPASGLPDRVARAVDGLAESILASATETAHEALAEHRAKADQDVAKATNAEQAATEELAKVVAAFSAAKDENAVLRNQLLEAQLDNAKLNERNKNLDDRCARLALAIVEANERTNALIQKMSSE